MALSKKSQDWVQELQSALGLDYQVQFIPGNGRDGQRVQITNAQDPSRPLVLPINLMHQPSRVGSVFTVGGQDPKDGMIFRHSVHMQYHPPMPETNLSSGSVVNAKSGYTDITARTATQNLALTVQDAFNNAIAAGSLPTQEFQRIASGTRMVSSPNDEMGLGPAVRAAANLDPRTKQDLYTQVSLTYGGPPNTNINFFKPAMHEELISHLSGEKAFADERQQGFINRLAESGYVFSKQGNLRQAASGMERILGPDGTFRWQARLDSGFKIQVQKPTIDSGGIMAYPANFGLDPQGAQQLNITQPGQMGGGMDYRYSSSLLPGETTPRANEVRTTVYGNTILAGGAFRYHNPNLQEPDMYVRKGQAKVTLPDAFTPDNIISGRVSLNLPSKRGEEYGFGEGTYQIGTVGIGDTEFPLEWAKGQSPFYASGQQSINIPSFYNKTTREWSRGGGEDDVSSRSLIKILQKQNPGIQFNRGTTDAVQLTMAGLYQTAVRNRGGGNKKGESPTGQEWYEPSMGRNIDYYTAEAKSPQAITRAFDAMSFPDISGLVGEWDASRPDDQRAMSSAVSADIEQQIAEGRAINWEQTAKVARRGSLGKFIGSGEELRARILQEQVFDRADDPAVNARNLKRGVGFIESNRWINQGPMDRSNTKIMRDSLARAYMAEDSSLSYRKAYRQTFNRIRSGNLRTETGFPIQEEYVTERLLAVTTPEPLVADNATARSSENSIFQMAMTSISENVSRKLGVNVDDIQAMGPRERSSASLYSYLLHQQDVNADVPGRRDPARVRNLSLEDMVDLNTLSGNKEMSNIDYAAAVAGKLGIDDEYTLLKAGKNFLPNPLSIMEKQYDKYGEEIGGLAKTYRRTMEETIGSELNDDGLNKDINQARAQKKLFSDIFGLREGLMENATAKQAATGFTFLHSPFGALPASAQSMGREMVDAVSRRASRAFGKAQGAVRKFINRNITPLFAGHYPMLQSDASSIMIGQHIPEGEVERRVGSQTFSRMRSARDWGITRTGYGWTNQLQADNDRDIGHSILGIDPELNLVGQELMPLGVNDLLTKERDLIPNQAGRDAANANVQSAVDIVHGVNVAQKALSKGTSMAYKELLQESLSVSEPGKGMGIAYNITSSTDAAANFSGLTNPNVQQGSQTIYSQALDRPKSPTPALSSIISSARFSQEYDKDRHDNQRTFLGFSVDQPGSNYKKAVRLEFSEGENGIEVSGMRRFMSEFMTQASKKIDTVDGKDIYGAGPASLASMFARNETHRAELQAALENVPEAQRQNVLNLDLQKFYRDNTADPNDPIAVLNEKRQKDLAMAGTIGFKALAGRATGKIDRTAIGESSRDAMGRVADYLSGGDGSSLVREWTSIAAADQFNRSAKYSTEDTFLGASAMADIPGNTPGGRIINRVAKTLGVTKAEVPFDINKVDPAGTPEEVGAWKEALSGRLGDKIKMAKAQRAKAITVTPENRSELESRLWTAKGEELEEIKSKLQAFDSTNPAVQDPLRESFNFDNDPIDGKPFNPPPAPPSGPPAGGNGGGGRSGGGFFQGPPSTPQANEMVKRAYSGFVKNIETIRSGYTALDKELGGVGTTWERMARLNQMDPQRAAELRGQFGRTSKTALGLQRDLRRGLAMGKYSSFDADDPIMQTLKSAMVGQNFEQISGMGDIGLNIDSGDTKINPGLMDVVNQFQESEEFMGLHGQMQQAGVFDRNVKGSMVQKLRGVITKNPQAQELLNRSISLRNAVPEALRDTHVSDEMQQMADYAQAGKKENPKIFQDRNIQIDLTGLGDQLKKLGEISEKVTPLVEKLTTAQGAEKKAIEEKLGAYNQEYDKIKAGAFAVAAREKASQLKNEFLATGQIDTDTTKKIDYLEKFASKNEEIAAGIQQEQKRDKSFIGRLGGAARHMLGGFGLMYLGSIANLAQSGLEDGNAEALDYEGILNRQATAFGGGRSIYSQDRAILNQKMISGSNISALKAMQLAGMQAPALGEAGNAAMAGVAAFGATSWGLQGLVSASALGPIGIGVGVGVAALNAGAQVWQRQQDPNSLAYRLSRFEQGAGYGDNNWGKISVYDELATTTMALTDPAKFEAMRNKAWQYGDIRTQMEQGAKFSELGAGTKLSDFEKYQMATTLQIEAADQAGKSLTPESIAKATYYARSGDKSTSPESIQKLAEQFDMGLAPDEVASAVMLAAGKNIFNQKKSGAKDFGSLMDYVVDNMADSSSQESVLRGSQFALGINKNGLRQMSGMSDVEKIDYLKQLDSLSGTNGGDSFAQAQRAYENALGAGLRVTAPQIAPYQTDDPLKLAQMDSSSQALQYQAQQRLQMGQNLANQSTFYGNAAGGAGQFKAIQGAPAGTEWFLNRAYNMDPMALATMASNGVNLSKLPGVTTMDGKTIDASYLAMTDMGLNGKPTGMAWGTSSLQMGSISGAQMANNIFGSNWKSNASFSQGLIGAMVSGQSLGGTITTPTGEQISSVGGMMGAQLYQAKMDRDFQLSQIALSEKGMNLSVKYQGQQNSIDDKQRALSNAYQMQQFAFQQESIQMNYQFGKENMGLNRQQSTLQRSWAREDWQTNDMMRNMQWSWSQDDFAEESRFMTGRTRKKAEKQNERDVTMHNLQEDQIDKERARQEKLWKLEDQRYEVQKRQFEESYKMQLRQLEASKEYYQQNFKLQEQSTKLAREHWNEEIKLQREAAKQAAQHTKEQFRLQQTMAQVSVATQIFEGRLKTAADSGFEALKNALLAINPLLIQMAENLKSIPTNTGASGGSSVGVNIGGGGNTNQKTNTTTKPKTPAAHGSRVQRGDTRLVGENGPEEFEADEPGRIYASYDFSRATPEIIPLRQVATPQGSSEQKIVIYIGNEQISDFVTRVVGNSIDKG